MDIELIRYFIIVFLVGVIVGMKIAGWTLSGK